MTHNSKNHNDSNYNNNNNMNNNTNNNNNNNNNGRSNNYNNNNTNNNNNIITEMIIKVLKMENDTFVLSLFYYVVNWILSFLRNTIYLQTSLWSKCC